MGRSDYLPERGHATHAWRIGLGLARGLPCKANSNHPSRFSKDARMVTASTILICAKVTACRWLLFPCSRGRTIPFLDGGADVH